MLIVEDNDTNLRLSTCLLSAHGYCVRLRRFKGDLALCDPSITALTTYDDAR